MPVIRIAKRDRYTTIPNNTLRDQSLSLAATGLLSMMLSYPDDWLFNYAHLINMKTNGRDAFKAAMRELIAAGYVRKAPKRNANGTVEGWEWEVLDEKPTVLLETRQTVEPSDGQTTPTKTERPTKTEGITRPSSVIERDANELAAVWNENCDALPSVRSVTGARRRKLATFVMEAGGIEQAKETLRKATLVVARDDFWRKGKYGLDNLLAGGKVFQRAEQYEAQESESKVGPEFSVGDAVEFRYRLGSMERQAYGVVRKVLDAQYIVLHGGDNHEYRVPFRDVRRA